MTPDELKKKVQEICAEASTAKWKATHPFRDQLGALFDEYRDDIFKISQRVPEHWEVEKLLAEKGDHDFDWRTYLRNEGLAFFTCSCGSREDSCSEDGDGNFSTFVFTPEGSVFRIVEKKS